MNIISKRIIAVSRFLIMTIGLFYAAVYIISSITRIMYPFAILNVEGASFQVLYALNSGYPLYGEPNIHYVSIVYTPLYFIISYTISFVTGFGYLPLRLLSFLSSIGIIFIIYLFVIRETNNKFLSLTSALFYILIYPLSGSWLDLAKPDSLMLLVLLISFYFIRFKDNLFSSLIAGILIAVSYMIKQQALSISIIVLLYLIISNFKKGITIALTCALSIIITHIIIDLVSQNWFTYFTFTLPTNITYKTILYEKILYFFTKDSIIIFPIMISFIILYFAYSLTIKQNRIPLFYLTLLIGIIVGILPTRTIYGGNLNSLMPYYVMIAIVAGISINKLLSLAKATETNGMILSVIIYTLLAAQFTMHLYNPLANIPKREQLKENEETVKTIESYNGEVFVENFGQLAVMAGKEETPHFGTLDDILIGDRGKVRDDIKSKYIKAFEEKHYSAVFLEKNWLNYDYNGEIKEALEGNYNYVGSDPSQRFAIYEPM